MKVTREQAVENREKVLAAAGELFREKGIDGVGIADLMKRAGLTHGGFYGQFKSKDDLAVHVCHDVMGRTVEKLAALADSSDDALAIFVANYLTESRRDALGTGCPLSGFGPEMGRQSKPVRHAFTRGFSAFIDVLEKMVPGRSKAARHNKALAVMSQMVGALVLSRAVTDPVLSRDILTSTLTDLRASAP